MIGKNRGRGEILSVKGVYGKRSLKLSALFSHSSKKRGQLTILVIIAILIVAVILVYLFWVEPNYISGRAGKLNFDSCVRDAFEQGIVDLSLTGGVINPKFYYLYDDNELPYYCYTNIPYKTCVVQQPMIKQFFEKQLKSKMKEKVNLCYENSVEELKTMGYNVTTGKTDLNLTIIPSIINVEVLAPTTIEGQRFTDYKMEIPSEIYDILMVATSIVQYETSYGDAPISELMYYYPHLIVDKFKMSDSTTVYVITDKETGLEFSFASRSLIWPAGYEGVGGVSSDG